MSTESLKSTAEALAVSSEVHQLLELWPSLAPNEHLDQFFALSRVAAAELFLHLTPSDQAEIFTALPEGDRRMWIRMLAPDDGADMIQHLPEEERVKALSLLDHQTRAEVAALMAYAEDDAGGLMNSRFARLRPDMTVEEAIRYLRAQTRANVETIYYAYVLDNSQRLQGVVSLRQLFTSPSEKRISELMTGGERLITIPETLDQEEVGRTFANKEFIALPVVDEEGRMKGIVTIDDIVKVVEEEATEDIQKLGGMEALDAPYFKIGFFELMRKRAGWLLALFVGELLTASAMGYYEDQIARAVVLALFIPLIISSGGNSGSQASTLIIRALAIGEIRLSDWWRVFLRESASGLSLGLILGLGGVARIYFWPEREVLYGAHYGLISIAVGISLIGIVLWGTVCGSMLPFVLQRLKLDPAVASAPFVATLVDVTGIIIYFSVASMLLGGVLL